MTPQDLRDLRVRAGVTRRRLATLAGTPVSMVVRVERAQLPAPTSLRWRAAVHYLRLAARVARALAVVLLLGVIGCGGDPCDPAIAAMWAGVLPPGEECPPVVEHDEVRVAKPTTTPPVQAPVCVDAVGSRCRK
jgi:hypothetical protein